MLHQRNYMKFVILMIFLLGMTFLANENARSQDIYPISSGELIFSFADVEKGDVDVPSLMRFTLFFHYGQFWHFDLNNNVGFFTGGAIRNVGLITREDNIYEGSQYDEDLKIKRRSYTLGVPLALKSGSFSKNFYIYGGGEYELLFHYKEKIFVEDRKVKSTEWMSDKTNRFVPSLFTGIQFPGGINVKFKYYLDDFLNRNYKVIQDGSTIQPFKNMQSRVFYISLHWNFKTGKMKDVIKADNIKTYAGM